MQEGYPSLIGCAIVQKVPYGKGSIWQRGTLPSPNDYRKLLRMACAEAGISIPEVTGTVTVVPRKGTNREGLIWMNVKSCLREEITEHKILKLKLKIVLC